MKPVQPTDFNATLFLLSSTVWSVGFEVPTQIATEYLEANAKRIRCVLNETVAFQCAIMPYGDGRYFVNVNASLQKEAGIQVGDEVAVHIEPDTSKYRLPMPEELQAIFEIDDEVDQLFHRLTPGKQRTLLHMIGKPKSSDIRIKKAMIITDYLRDVNGKLDFEELKIAFKQAR